MDDIGWDDEAAALAEDGHFSADGDLERAFGDVARLHVRVGVERADRALVKAEFDLHQLGAADENAAPIAGSELGPGRSAALGDERAGHQMARPSGPKTW